MSSFEFAMLAKSLVSESTRMEANGSGWNCNYEATLYCTSLDKMFNYFENQYPKSNNLPTIHPNGFLFCYQTFHFLDAIYLDLDHITTIKNNSFNYIHLLPPISFSFEYLPILNDLVDTVLANSGVPKTDRKSLVRLLFFMLKSHEEISTRECVPLFLDFNKTTVLRSEAEAADWLCGGTMDSVVVRTLRATHEVIKKLEMMSFDASLCKTETCMVCLEGFGDDGDCDGDGDERVSRLPCSHEFHHDCIAEWLRSNHRCPVCRFPTGWVHVMRIEPCIHAKYEVKPQMPQHQQCLVV